MPQRSVAYPAKWNAARGPDHVDVVILQKNRILARIVTGIRNHFPVRVSEWIMTYALYALGLVFLLDPDTFEKSTSFAEMARFADQRTWGIVLLFAGNLRLIGLGINGTFHEHFKYAPHLRGVASLVSCFMWGQITLGVTAAYFTSGGVLTGFVIYSAAMATDLWNLFRAWADVGAARANTSDP